MNVPDVVKRPIHVPAWLAILVFVLPIGGALWTLGSLGFVAINDRADIKYRLASQEGITTRHTAELVDIRREFAAQFASLRSDVTESSMKQERLLGYIAARMGGNADAITRDPKYDTNPK